MTNKRCMHRQSSETRFALGYLQGQSKGLARGIIVWATLRVAIDKAIASGASADEILAAVTEGVGDAPNASERTLDVM